MNQNTLKIVVPIIAVIVLIESVLLISGIQKKKTQNEVSESSPTTQVITEGAESAVYDINISADKSELNKGESGKMNVTLKGSTARSLDSVNIYVKYDPTAFDVPELMFDKKLPKPVFSKVSTSRGLLVANFLISDAEGLKLDANEELSLMEFNFSPKKSGEFNFEISTGNEMKESATMIVENTTSKVLPFSSNKLTVKVSE